nr:phosphate/phosphite/phosphonate ABC transporter substrate-binding protein [Hyphomonas sp. BRH_c22]
MRRVWIVMAFLFAFGALEPASAQKRGTRQEPLRVLLIPADGGTEDGTKADFKPLFDAITRTSGLYFDVQVGQSYAAVIEGMCAGLADIAWFGPVSFIEARNRGCAELLAVEERDGSSTYYAALFVSASSDIRAVEDLQGHSLALGSSHSASSFAYPIAMIAQAGIDPLFDLGALRLTGSHANSLMALKSGQVDAAGASLVSFERAVNQAGLDASAFRILAKSDPIPNPPIAMNPGLSVAMKSALRDAIAGVHAAPGVNQDAIRGYGGKRVDRYDTRVDETVFTDAAAAIAFIDDDFKAAVLRKAGAAQN